MLNQLCPRLRLFKSVPRRDLNWLRSYRPPMLESYI